MMRPDRLEPGRDRSACRLVSTYRLQTFAPPFNRVVPAPSHDHGSSMRQTGLGSSSPSKPISERGQLCRVRHLTISSSSLSLRTELEERAWQRVSGR